MSLFPNKKFLQRKVADPALGMSNLEDLCTRVQTPISSWMVAVSGEFYLLCC